jgi:hypothetical protein
MATNPDDIVLESTSPAGDDDRTVESVGGHRSDFEAVPSIAQLPKKPKGQCRMVVEFPFMFSPEFLKAKGFERGRPYLDGVDYLRTLQVDFENGDIDLGDLQNLSIEHGDNGLRATAAK